MGTSGAAAIPARPPLSPAPQPKARSRWSWRCAEVSCFRSEKGARCWMGKGALEAGEDDREPASSSRHGVGTDKPLVELARTAAATPNVRCGRVYKLTSPGPT
jgi:hypothetical protein